MANFLKDNLPNILKYATVLAVIVFISFLFPSTSDFSYNYKEGQNWTYDDLVAEFQFPILKRKAQIKTEKAAIIQDFIPFYDYHHEVIDTVLREFDEKFNELKSRLQLRGERTTITSQPRVYKQLGEQILKDLFNNSYLITMNELGHDTTQTELIRIVGNTGIVKKVSREELTPLNIAGNIISNKLAQSTLKDAGYLVPIMNDVVKIHPNTYYNAQRTQDILHSKLADISTTRGIVEKGETIVSKGQIVSPEVYQKLLSYENEYVNRNVGERRDFIVFLGLMLLTTLIVGVYLLFLQFNAREVYDRYLSLLFMLLWIVLYSYLVSVINGVDNLSVYIIPFCIVPILVINFFSDRLALFTHIVIILLASLLSSEGHEFTFLQIFVGIVTVLTFKPSRYWGKFFTSILFIFLAYSLGYLGLSLIRVGSIYELDWTPLVWLFISSFLTLLAFPLVPLLERIFGFTSNITLSELSDLNRPLLKRLTTESPGTFQHSLQVSNLGESVAEAIGANALSVKVGALYHDVGKLKNPEYFVENQGAYNPHEDIDCKESAQIIIDHVPTGIKLAKKQHLPKLIIDFIRTHHGTTRVEYFYRNYKKENPDIQVDPAAFTYPGPKPQTREQAVLMIADSLEASSRSLKNPDGQAIDKLVDSIIDGKIEREQFAESDLTFRDIKTCREEFKKLLRSMYHVRIEYPEEEE